jgi:hypothetical protein
MIYKLFPGGSEMTNCSHRTATTKDFDQIPETPPQVRRAAQAAV